MLEELKARLTELVDGNHRLEEPCEDNGYLFGVWLEDDLIGAGTTAVRAYADAIETVSGWGPSVPPDVEVTL